MSFQLDLFTERAQKAISLAQTFAKKLKQNYVGTEHLIYGLLKEKTGTAAEILVRNGVEEERVQKAIGSFLSEEEGVKSPVFSPKLEEILEKSVVESNKDRLSKAGTEHLLLAIIVDFENSGCRLLEQMNINVQKVFLDLIKTLGRDTNQAKNDYYLKRKATQAKKKSTTPMLDRYSRDLTQIAKDGMLDPVIGREYEIQRLMQILSRRTKNNPCLTGEPGVGKTAIVEGLAQMLSRGTVPETIVGKKLLSLDLSAMVAGTKYRGEFEERMKKMLEELRSNGEVLLFIDEIHTIIGAGGAEGSMDAANILKPALSRGEIQIIGATTRNEYRKYIEKDAALERRFQPVVVEEPSEEQAIQILEGLYPQYEKHHGVRISKEAIKAAVTLSERYINDRFLPDKSIDLMDEAASRKRLLVLTPPTQLLKLEEELSTIEKERENAIERGDFEEASLWNEKQEKKQKQYDRAWKRYEKEKNSAVEITEDDIASVVAMWTKIPVERLNEKESERLLHLEDTLHKRVIGQKEAVSAVSKAIKRGRVGLKDPNRPVGSFLFLGPTGVGKTELSKALSEAIFGTEDSIIRIDMSEYMEKHSVSKMIGSPPGYVGYEEGGQLSEKVRQHPYSVVLFDEIEKAHEDVFNLLLQVLDDGHITDSQGRKVDFKNTVIIMTSNTGASTIVEPKKLGFKTNSDSKVDYENMKSNVMEELKHSFKPEFLNRIDEIIVFHTLERQELMQIVELLLKDLKKRAFLQMGISLEVDISVKEYILEKGYDEKYGARPLRRAVQTELEDLLAEEILSGHMQEGNVILVKMEEGKVHFERKETVEKK
ncbi:MAG: ATP-dependent Clp protease ATP-binding subunit [Clostridiales bacterium]|nr:ATP-dependent Clp protease ATP-binding subunit [Clostridiales bacterium]